MEDRKDFIEQILGGVFGIIAVIAAIAELFANGINAASVLGCVKDVFGTLAIIILFFAIIKDAIPKRKFEDKLKCAIEEWIDDNSNMLLHKEEHDIGENGKAYFSIDMKTDISDFYDNGHSKNTGLFVRIPQIESNNFQNPASPIELFFSMNKGTFFPEISAAELTKDSYKKLADNFMILLKEKHGKCIETTSFEENKKVITVKLSKSIKSKSDINEFIDILNTMYTAYLVSARIK